VLDWKQTPQEAVGTASFFARTPEIIAEKARMPAETSNALRALGWNIVEGELWSGTHAIQVTPKGLVGGADPREEGKAIALPAAP
jgi:gamma-glutamyltranspeptidase/glutathione hydrolase